jgi:hypothetical protein
MFFDGLDDLFVEAEAPPIASEADNEYQTRIDAARVTAEFRVPLTPAVAQRDHRELPLFGSINEQKGLFD